MTDNNGEELARRSERLFSARTTWWTLCEELAGKFAPDLGYFFTVAEPGQDFASHNFDATSMLAFNDFTNAMQMNMRPDDRQWFEETLNEGHDDLSLKSKDWMKRRSRVLWRLIYGKRTQSKKAFRQADRMTAAFGEYCISTSRLMNRDGSFGASLLFQTWHPATYTYELDFQGETSEIHRKASMPVSDAERRFGRDALSQEARSKCSDPKRRNELLDVRHCVMPGDEYEYVTRKKPLQNADWVSIWFDYADKRILKETPQTWPLYTIGRWQQVPGIPWGFSPMALTAIATSRRNDELMLAMLEQAQKQGDPPMVATSDVIDGEVDLGPGGVTWIDKDYDERLGDALRPLKLGGESNGTLDLLRDGRDLLAQAWARNKLVLPQRAKTAYETQQLVEEYIRANMPIFSPLEEEMSQRILENVAAAGAAMGAYGSEEFQREHTPPELFGQETEFSFETPLRSALERAKVLKYEQMLQLRGATMEQDPEAVIAANLRDAFAETLGIIGEPGWTLDEEQQEARLQQMQQAAQVQQMAALAQQGGAAAEQVGKGMEALGAAGALGMEEEAAA